MRKMLNGVIIDVPESVSSDYLEHYKQLYIRECQETLRLRKIVKELTYKTNDSKCKRCLGETVNYYDIGKRVCKTCGNTENI
jgi:methionyl-tRNA synthetase